MPFFSFLLLPLLWLAPPQSPARQSDALAWSAQRPLAWADFQSRPAPADRLAALTSTTIDAQVGCQDFVFSARVRAVFVPTESWVREATKASPHLLRHEQLHFDITEFYARRLRQKLSQAKLDCQHLQPAFQNLTKANFTEWQREESRYDQETNHGLNEVQQRHWERQVQQRLALLEAFAI